MECSNLNNVRQENKNVAKKLSALFSSKKRHGKIKSSTFADSNPCFTIPEESKGKMKIIRKNTHYFNKVASGGILIEGNSRPLSSKNKRAHKTVSFDDINNIYGSTPENTSSESNETLPYNKYYHHEYLAKTFRKQDKKRLARKEYDNTIKHQVIHSPNRGTLNFSSENLAEIKSGHVEIAANNNYNSGTSNGITSDTTVHDVDEQHYEDTKNTLRNSKKNKAETLSGTSSFDRNKGIEISKSGKTHSSIKSPLLVSSIPKPSGYINRPPVSLSNKDRGASISSVKPSSPGALSAKGKSASISGVKTSSPAALSAKDKGASITGAKTSSPGALSTKGKDTSTSGVKPSSPAMDILRGSSISKDCSNHEETKNKQYDKIFASKEPLHKDITNNMNIDSDQTSYSTTQSLPLKQYLNNLTENKVQIQPGEKYNSHISKDPVQSKSPVDNSSLFYSQRKEKESTEQVRSTNRTNTAENSFKSSTSYSMFYKDPNETVIKKDVIPSDSAYTNYTNVLAFPEHVDYKSPFQNIQNSKNAFGEEFATENGYKQEDNMSRKLIEPPKINSDHDKETLVSVQSILSELSSPGFTIGENTQNTTFNVFYESGRKTEGEANTLNLSTSKEQNPQKMEKSPSKVNMSLGNGPKGLLIFVNKKTIGSFDEFDDESLLTRQDFPLHDPYMQKSSMYDYPRIKQSPIESSGDSKRKPYISSDWNSGKQTSKPKDTEKSLRPKSHSEGRLGRSSLFSKYFDKIRNTFSSPRSKNEDQQNKESKMSVGRFGGQIYPSMSKKSDNKYSKTSLSPRSKNEDRQISDGTFEGQVYPSMSKKSDSKYSNISLSPRFKTKRYWKPRPTYASHAYPKGSSKGGQDKPLTVERSPSGSRITEKYPCGCLRIITIDKDNELETEQFISAFCRDGSLCAIQHPELQKNKRTIVVPGSSKSSISLPLSRCWFPNIEMVADGIISRNKIPERPPAPYMKGAKYSGTINVKTDNVNGVCNLYFDPRLLRYLIANIDEVKAVAEEFRQQ